ncbi:MAG: metal-dependent transcriptional regulator [Firmicutes bacterium]|nr:metal-dependent transcriptional regulator [Bacillota bacterium]
MKIHESAENYLETIHMLKRQNGSVRSIDIAHELGFSKPSVSVAMKNLREHGYIVVNDGGSIELTDLGQQVADRMFERHTLLTNCLVALGVSPEVAAEDACKIEHVLSDESFKAIKAHEDKFR